MKVFSLYLYILILSNFFEILFQKLESSDVNNKKQKHYNYFPNIWFFLSPLIFSSLYFVYKRKLNNKNFQKYIEQENSKPIIYVNNNDEIRGEYSKYISQKRRKQKTPKKLVDERGKIIFGTFEKEFEEMDLLRANGPTRLPNFFNKYKLTLWEVGEVNLKDGVLLGGLCDMGFSGFHFNMFYDKRTKSTYCWETKVLNNNVKISKNLINGNIAELKTKNSYIKFINNFEKGECLMYGKHIGKCLLSPYDDTIKVDNINNNYKQCSIEYEFKMERLSKPSVVSLPFPYSNNRALYSQKDFFKITGKLKINGEEMLTDENTTALIDDHRGYYPRKAHYDWLTTMGKFNINNKKQYFAFNLTHNQSTDEESYNENIIWLEKKTSLLPPVKFNRSVPCNKFSNYSEWTVKDKYDMVNVKFKVYGIIPIVFDYCLFKLDYYITFGVLEGYLRDEEGKKYNLDGMMGLGEDKTLLI